MIRYANDAYYNKKPVVTDNVYDILKEYIERNFPDNIAITEVGAPDWKEQSCTSILYGFNGKN